MEENTLIRWARKCRTANEKELTEIIDLTADSVNGYNRKGILTMIYNIRNYPHDKFEELLELLDILDMNVNGPQKRRERFKKPIKGNLFDPDDIGLDDL